MGEIYVKKKSTTTWYLLGGLEEGEEVVVCPRDSIHWLGVVAIGNLPVGDQTPQVPPKPTVTSPPATMTGCSRLPFECSSILANSSGFIFMSTYSTS